MHRRKIDKKTKRGETEKIKKIYSRMENKNKIKEGKKSKQQREEK